MILMKFLIKYKILYLLFIFIFSTFFNIYNENLISNAITCISIVFAFSQSFLLATYANKDINTYMKNKNNMFKGFIDDNKHFLKIALWILILLFNLDIFSFHKNYKDFIYISSNHIALLLIIWQLDKTYEFVDNYMNVYKNSYSDKVLKDIGDNNESK